MTQMTLFNPDAMNALRALFGTIQADKELPCHNHPLGRVLIHKVKETSRGYLIHWT